MQEIKLEYTLSVVKSEHKNDCVLLKVTNIEWKTQEYWWKQAVEEMEDYEYLWGKSNIKYVKELKKMTDKAYKIKHNK